MQERVQSPVIAPNAAIILTFFMRYMTHARANVLSFYLPESKKKEKNSNNRTVQTKRQSHAFIETISARNR